MNPRQPPKHALRLLKRIGNEPLTGDLLEELRNGRTNAWFWRQTIVAIATDIAFRVRIFKRELHLVFVVWAAQFALIFTLWLFRVPAGVQALPWAVAGWGAARLAAWWSERKLSAAFDDDDCSSEEYNLLSDRLAPVALLALFMRLPVWNIWWVSSIGLMEHWLLPAYAHPSGWGLQFFIQVSCLCFFSIKIVTQSPDTAK